jgi:hypothetical protein
MGQPITDARLANPLAPPSRAHCQAQPSFMSPIISRAPDAARSARRLAT